VVWWFFFFFFFFFLHLSPLSSLQAISQRNLHLATLIPQSTNLVVSRLALKEQLKQWTSQAGSASLSKLIDANLLPVFRLLSRDVDAVASGLDWERCLGLLMWFGTENSTTEPIAKLIEEFDRRRQTGKFAAPLPRYLSSTPPFNQRVDTVVVHDGSVLLGSPSLLYRRQQQQQQQQHHQQQQWKALAAEEQKKLLHDRTRTPLDAVTTVTSKSPLQDIAYSVMKLFADPQ
jgi:hypothetical protein